MMIFKQFSWYEPYLHIFTIWIGMEFIITKLDIVGSISVYILYLIIYIHISHVHVEIPRFHGSIFNPNIYRAYISSCISTTSPTPATHLPPAAAGSARRSACSPRARCARVATTDRLMGAGNVFGTVGRAVFFLNDTGPGMLLKKLRTWHKHPEKPGSRVIFTCEI